VPASAVIPKISQDLQQKRRSEWNSIRPEYRKWFENNYNVKPNWKDSWDCHHILPIQFNGQNNYSNILVMDRKFHQQKVTPWWTNY
jgi:5-methylcytosine-specific restriction endonuclease McrA